MAACKSNIFLIILVILKKIILCNKTIIITTYYKIWSHHQNYDLKTKFKRQGNTKITCEIADLNFIYCFICWTAKCLEEISQKFLAQQKNANFLDFLTAWTWWYFTLIKRLENWFLLPNFLFRSFLYHQLTAFANILAPIQTLPQCQPGYWFPLENHNPAIFSVLPGTEKLNKSLQADKKALVIPTCCTCLTITLILIPELPANTS